VDWWIGGLVIGGHGSWSYYKQYEKEVNRGLKLDNSFQASILTETDMQHLPESVRKYLRYVAAVGKSKVNNIKDFKRNQ